MISGGRLDWGIGAGWYDHEFRGYGYEFPAPKVRIGMLRETVEIVKAMWTEPDVTYKGRYYELDGAQCDPKPVQQPHPPIWIGGGGEQLTLRVVARHATHSNFGGKPHEWTHKRDVLRQHCADVGRDSDEITKTWSPEVFIRETEAEVDGRRLAVVLGRAGRVVDGGQPRRHARAGLREDPGLRGPRLRRVRAVVQRLPRHRDAAAVRRKGAARAPLSPAATPRSRTTKRAPPRGESVASTVPPWAATASRTIASPSRRLPSMPFGTRRGGRSARRFARARRRDAGAVVVDGQHDVGRR